MAKSLNVIVHCLKSPRATSKAMLGDLAEVWLRSIEAHNVLGAEGALTDYKAMDRPPMSNLSLCFSISPGVAIISLLQPGLFSVAWRGDAEMYE